MILLYDEHLGDTIISGNTNLRKTIILESRELVLSYLQFGLHSGDEKYTIQLSKIEAVTNINFHKITERVL